MYFQNAVQVSYERNGHKKIFIIRLFKLYNHNR